MGEIVELKSIPKKSPLSDDTAQVLRNIADMVERGEVSEIIVCAVTEGNYSFFQFSSLSESLVLAQLYLDWIIQKFRG